MAAWRRECAGKLVVWCCGNLRDRLQIWCFCFVVVLRIWCFLVLFCFVYLFFLFVIQGWRACSRYKNNSGSISLWSIVHLRNLRINLRCSQARQRSELGQWIHLLHHSSIVPSVVLCTGCFLQLFILCPYLRSTIVFVQWRIFMAFRALPMSLFRKWSLNGVHLNYSVSCMPFLLGVSLIWMRPWKTSGFSVWSWSHRFGHMV